MIFDRLAQAALCRSLGPRVTAAADLLARPGRLAVLLPGEPRAPLIGEGPLTKVVAKVLIP